MKKLLLAALIVVAAGSSAFASDETKVGFKVKNSFEAQFEGATNAVWTTKDDYLKVSFTLADENVEAFFSVDGEMMGMSRTVDLKKLPLNAIQSIKKIYSAYKVTDTIEFDQEGNKCYYVMLENGNQKSILKVSLYGEVSLFKGTIK